MALTAEEKIVKNFANLFVQVQTLAVTAMTQLAEANQRIRDLEGQVDNLEIRVFGAAQVPGSEPPPPSA